MRRQLILSALIGISSAALFAGSAFAGDWGCGRCGLFAPARVTYAALVVTYAAPTYTVVPHYVVQPHYVVERTYVIRQTRYIREAAPCVPGCRGRYVVNQGQYSERAPFALPFLTPAAYPHYAPAVYPRYYHHYYHRHAPLRGHYYAPHLHRGYFRHARHLAVAVHRTHWRAAHRAYRRMHYR